MIVNASVFTRPKPAPEPAPERRSQDLVLIRNAAKIVQAKQTKEVLSTTERAVCDLAVEELEAMIAEKEEGIRRVQTYVWHAHQRVARH